MTRHRHQHRDGQFGGTGRVPRRGVHDDDPLPRGSCEINRVDTDTGPDNDFQAGLTFEGGSGELGGTADDDAVSLGEFLPQLFERADRLVDDLDPGGLLENLESGLGEIVSDQYAKHGRIPGGVGSRPPVGQ